MSRTGVDWVEIGLALAVVKVWLFQLAGVVCEAASLEKEGQSSQLSN